MSIEETASVLELGPDQLDKVSGGSGGGAVTAQGSFVSSTGTDLNILVCWEAVADMAGQKTLNVTVYSQSYSLSSIAMETGAELTVNGAVYYSASHAVNYSGRVLANNVLAGFSIPNLTGTLNLAAVWHFNGCYSGKPLGDIRAEAVIAI